MTRCVASLLLEYVSKTVLTQVVPEHMSGNTKIWISRPTVSCAKCTWWDILSGESKQGSNSPLGQLCWWQQLWVWQKRAGTRFCDPLSPESAVLFCKLTPTQSTLQNTVTLFHQSSLSVEVCCHLMEALMILCSHAYLMRAYTKPSFAECYKSQTANIPLVNITCSLFPSSCVQLGELLFPFKFGEISVGVFWDSG